MSEKEYIVIEALRALQISILVKANASAFSVNEVAAAQAVIDKLAPEMLEYFGVEVEK